MKSKDLPLKEFDRNFHDVPMMKLGLGIRLFFPRPFARVRAAVKGLWEKYLAWVGKDAFTWARLGGGNKSRPVSDSTFKTVDAWLSGKTSYGDACWVSINDGPMDDLGKHTFFLEGQEGDPKEQDGGYVNLTVPIAFLDAHPEDELAAKFVGLAADLPFLSGAAGFMFQHTTYRQNDCAPHMAALSERYQGVEATFSDRMNYWSKLGLTTVNWLTFVGEPFLEKLGGRALLQKRLPKECHVTTLKHGLALRSSPTPLLGDRHSKKDDLAAWRKVYAAVKSAQFRNLQYCFHPFHFNEERTDAWLGRLEE